MKLLNSDNSLPLVLTILNKYPRLLEEKHERKRLIIGLISILLLPEKSQTLIESIPLIFKNLIKLVKKNTRSRIILCKY